MVFLKTERKVTASLQYMQKFKQIFLEYCTLWVVLCTKCCEIGGFTRQFPRTVHSSR